MILHRELRYKCEVTSRTQGRDLTNLCVFGLKIAKMDIHFGGVHL